MRGKRGRKAQNLDADSPPKFSILPMTATDSDPKQILVAQWSGTQRSVVAALPRSLPLNEGRFAETSRELRCDAPILKSRA